MKSSASLKRPKLNTPPVISFAAAMEAGGIYAILGEGTVKDNDYLVCLEGGRGCFYYNACGKYVSVLTDMSYYRTCRYRLANVEITLTFSN